MIFIACYSGGRLRADRSKALLHQVRQGEQQGEGCKHRVGVSEPPSDREQVRDQVGAAGQLRPPTGILALFFKWTVY